MKFSYNILWLDNDLQSYIDNGSVESIEDFLLERGFEPTIVKVFDEADLDQALSKNNYDLIISDYNLENTTGDVIIEDIRIKKQLDTEILFYTAQASYKSNPKVKERLAFIDRLTFQVGRATLLEKIEKTIRLTLKQLFELNATRGLITAATSELDVEIEEIYFKIIDTYAEQQKTKMEKIFKRDYNEIKKYLLKKCRTQRNAHLTDYKTYFSKSDSFRKWNILKELISLDVPPGFDLTLFKKYKTEVIDIRNQFAHAKSVTNDHGIAALKGEFGKNDFEFTEENCVEIRKKLINHKHNIEKLKLLLKIN